MAQVDTNGKHGLFLHEQLIHLHTENTQTKLQTWHSIKILWKMVTCYKEPPDDNFKFDENGGKFSKRVENTVNKGETACYMHFPLFPSVFSKDLHCRHIKTRACLGKG